MHDREIARREEIESLQKQLEKAQNEAELAKECVKEQKVLASKDAEVCIAESSCFWWQFFVFASEESKDVF